MCLLHHILKNSNEHAQWMLMILMQRANNNEYTQRSEIVIILQQVRWGKLSCVVDSSSPQFFAMSCHDGREWGTKKNASFSHTQNPSLMSFSDESKWLCDFFSLTSPPLTLVHNCLHTSLLLCCWWTSSSRRETDRERLWNFKHAYKLAWPDSYNFIC